MKTPINELIEWIKDFDNRNLTISRFDLDLKINKLLENEKQMIICVFNDGRKIQTKLIKNIIILEKSEDKTDYASEAEQYYNETFKL